MQLNDKARKSRRTEALRTVRRELILTAAASIFAEAGFEHATMRNIAAEAGCTTGAVYPLFASKEDIYAALLMRSLTALDACVTEAFCRADPGWDQVDSCAKAFVQYYLARPSELALGLHLFSNGIGKRGLSRSLDQELNQQLWKCLSLIERGLIYEGIARCHDPRTETMVLFSALSGVLVAHHTGRLKAFGQRAEVILDRQLTIARQALGQHQSNDERN